MREKTAFAMLSVGAAAAAGGCFLPWASVRQPWVFSGIDLPVSVYYGRPFISDPPWLSPNPSPLGSAGALLIVTMIIGTIANRWRPVLGLGTAVVVIAAPVLVVMTFDREPEYFVPQAVGDGLSVVVLGGIGYLLGAALRWSVWRRESAGRPS